MMWLIVGKSAILRPSILGMLNASLISAMNSACFTVSIPRSASRSRSGSSKSVGYPVFSDRSVRIFVLTSSPTSALPCVPDLRVFSAADASTAEGRPTCWIRN